MTTESSESSESSDEVLWMKRPHHAKRCFNGLEYLVDLESIFVKQVPNLPETLERDIANCYFISNREGERIYYAYEISDAALRNSWGHRRPFNIVVFDQTSTEILNFYRPLACDHCCCPCCLQTIVVTTSEGVLLGKVRQPWQVLWPRLTIEDYRSNVIYNLNGPACTCSWCFCCGCYNIDVEFFISTTRVRKATVGRLTKYWTGFFEEALTDADNFGMRIPKDMNVEIKAVLLGACFLLDYMYFEASARERCKCRNICYCCCI